MPKLALSHSSVYRYKLLSFFKSRKGKRKEARTTAANNRRYERYFPLTILLTLSCSDERTCSRKQLLKVGINQQQDYINFLWQCKERWLTTIILYKLEPLTQPKLQAFDKKRQRLLCSKKLGGLTLLLAFLKHRVWSIKKRQTKVIWLLVAMAALLKRGVSALGRKECCGPHLLNERLKDNNTILATN